MPKSLLLLVAVASLASNVDAGDQAYGVEGCLLCGTKPAVGVKVALYDQDSLDPSDLMGDGATGADGCFKIAGCESELSDINPELYIWHDCDDRFPGSREVKIVLPSSYITGGKTPETHFPLGTLNLETKFMEESRSLLTR